jgi:hypothetical protein
LGIGAKIFPFGQKYPVVFYVGTEIRFGSATNVEQPDLIYYDESGNYETAITKEKYPYSAFLVSPGVSYEMMNRFIIGAELSLGLYLNQSNELRTLGIPTLMIGVSF